MDDQPKQQDSQQIQLRIDESKMTSAYANTIRTSTTADEVVMDFGLNIPMQGSNNQPMMVFNVGSRVIMNWAGAKRLAANLGQAVRKYEQQFGEIQLQRVGQPGPAAEGPDGLEG